MKLPAEVLAEITESVTIVGRDEPRAVDRRSPRVKLSSHLFGFDWSNPSQPFSIRVRDLSEGGVGIFRHERVALDEKLVVRFPLKNEHSLMVLGTVMYWEPLAEDLYAIGVQFEQIIDQAALDIRIEETSRKQVNHAGVLSRLSNALAQSWAKAS